MTWNEGGNTWGPQGQQQNSQNGWPTPFGRQHADNQDQSEAAATQGEPPSVPQQDAMPQAPSFGNGSTPEASPFAPTNNDNNSMPSAPSFGTGSQPGFNQPQPGQPEQPQQFQGAQPQWGQQPQWKQPQWNQPPQGQQPGQAPFDQSQFGQPQFGQEQVGQPGQQMPPVSPQWGQPAASEPTQAFPQADMPQQTDAAEQPEQSETQPPAQPEQNAWGAPQAEVAASDDATGDSADSDAAGELKDQTEGTNDRDETASGAETAAAAGAAASWSTAGNWTNDAPATDAQPTQAFGSGDLAATAAYPAGGFDHATQQDMQATQAYQPDSSWPQQASEFADGTGHEPELITPLGAEQVGPVGPAGQQPFPAPGGPHDPNGLQDPNGPQGPQDTNNDGKKQPWHKRKAVMIPLVAVILLGIAAAIGIPWFLHQQNVDKGDKLAAQFQTDLQEYEDIWTAENIDSVNAADVANLVRSSGATFYNFGKSGLASLQDTCAIMPDVRERYNTLAESKAPDLPAEDGADASEAYRQAQKDAKKLEEQRKNAEEFLTASEKSVKMQEEFCANYDVYTDALGDFTNDLKTTMPDAMTLKKGDEVKIEGTNLFYTCDSDSGCPNLYAKDTREKYAKAHEATYVDYAKKMAKNYKESCFMSDFQAACDAAADAYQKAADANQKVVDLLMNNEPTTEAGKPLYPDLQKLMEEAIAAEEAADKALLDKWKEVEPGVGTEMAMTGVSLAAYMDEARDAALAAADKVK
ncbi:hypothetical protein [Gulosibacter bifidus]|uniref:Uncharacterized protein n=1 Tax=Gulosibacter bifidus TaxID=272239 RepID=A0ABW5RH11_9MICO|nr:hypothetical protein [Gulosibacter bifidus]